MESEFVAVHIKSTDSDDHKVPNYLLMCLPQGGDFRKEGEYVTLEASWLKVNGIGFATSGCEFSEYGEKITVRQDTPGGSVMIELPE